MKKRLKALFRRRQAGLTLIEMMAVLAVTAIIGLGASVATAQVLNQTSRNADYTTASRHVMNAIHWLGRDIQMAQTVNGTAGFPESSNLSLTWTWWDNSEYSVNYTVTGGTLRRIYSNGSAQTETVIAEYIRSDLASTNITSDNGTFIFTITASVGEGADAIDVTRSREVSSRPHL